MVVKHVEKTIERSENTKDLKALKADFMLS